MKSIRTLAASLAMLACTLATPSKADLGGESISFTVAGAEVGMSWSVSDSGVLTQSISALASQTVQWQATVNGCSELLGPFPIPPGALTLRTSACSSGIVCRDGQQVFRIQSGIWIYPVIGDRYRIHQMIDREFFPAGSC